MRGTLEGGAAKPGGGGSARQGLPASACAPGPPAPLPPSRLQGLRVCPGQRRQGGRRWGGALTSLAGPGGAARAASTPGHGHRPGAAPGLRLPLASCRVSCPTGSCRKGQREGTAGVTQRFARAVPLRGGGGGGDDMKGCSLPGWRRGSLPGAGAAWQDYGPGKALPALRPAQAERGRPQRATPSRRVPRHPEHRGSGDGHAPGALMWTFPLHGPCPGSRCGGAVLTHPPGRGRS